MRGDQMGYILTTSTEQEILETIRFVGMIRGAHEVVVAPNTYEVLQLARRNKPNLTIWDLDFNNRVESKHLSQWCADSALRPVPLMLLTATRQSGRQMLPASLRDGTTYLVKPVDLVELGLRISGLLDSDNRHSSAPPPAGHQQQVGDLILDYNLFQVTVDDDKAISLTPTEFKLLCHFMENPGQTYSSNQLLDEVWKYPPGAGSPDVVRIYVKRLRDKIEPDPQEPQYIVTIPGHGYRMPIPETPNEPSNGRSLTQPSNGIGDWPHGTAPAMADDETLREILLTLQTVTQTCQTTLMTIAHLVDELSDSNNRQRVEPVLHQQAPSAAHQPDRANTPTDEIAAAAQSLNKLASELQTTLTQLRTGWPVAETQQLSLTLTEGRGTLARPVNGGNQLRTSD